MKPTKWLLVSSLSPSGFLCCQGPFPRGEFDAKEPLGEGPTESNASETRSPSAFELRWVVVGNYATQVPRQTALPSQLPVWPRETARQAATERASHALRHFLFSAIFIFGILGNHCRLVIYSIFFHRLCPGKRTKRQYPNRSKRGAAAA